MSVSCTSSRLFCLVTTLWLLAPPAPLHAQSPPPSGDQLYQGACAACHGTDGRGQPRSIVGFDTPLPDFTDCGFTTPEADLDWSSVIHKGGRIRGLDRRMPAFGEALSEAQIASLIHHVRGFCEAPGWPRGELNFPRAFFTEKAFPENEAVMTVVAGPDAIEHGFLFEHRIGRRAQYEVNVPVALQQDAASQWHRGLGDMNAAFKYALYDSLARGLIVSAGGEVTLPTGKEGEGLGGGTSILEGFAMFGKALPGDAFVQFHAGIEAPVGAAAGANEVYWRTAVGKTYTVNTWGRAWSPMVEVLGAKELDGAEPEWDLVPQLQVSLSGLQHVLVSVGVRVPVNERSTRGHALVAYLLWDWFDGSFFSHWSTR